jgi:hypothetical protein
MNFKNIYYNNDNFFIVLTVLISPIISATLIIKYVIIIV